MTTMPVLSETRPPRLEPAPVLERETMAVSILIVTWNSAPWIERCLTSIETASGGLRYEVLVFDNASNDGTAAIVRRSGGDRINCFESPANLGFAGAMNRLIEKAKGEYLLCLNADAEPESGSIAKLVEHLERNPDVAGAVPLLSHDDGASQHEWQLRSLPSMRSIAAEVLLLDKILPRNDWSRNDYRGIDLADVQQVEQPAAAAMLLGKVSFDRSERSTNRLPLHGLKMSTIARGSRTPGCRSIWFHPRGRVTSVVHHSSRCRSTNSSLSGTAIFIDT